MSAATTPEQEAYIQKLSELAQNDPEFLKEMTEDEGAALEKYGLSSEYQRVFADTDVVGYREIAPIDDGSTCCVTNISNGCCVTNVSSINSCCVTWT